MKLPRPGALAELDIAITGKREPGAGAMRWLISSSSVCRVIERFTIIPHGQRLRAG